MPDGGGGGVPRPPRGGGGGGGGGRGGGGPSDEAPPAEAPTAPVAPVPVPPPPAAPSLPVSPLDELLKRPPSPLTPLLNQPMSRPPLGEVTVKARRPGTATPRPGRGGGLGLGGVLSLASRFAAPLALLVPTPIGDQPDDPSDFGEKQRGERPEQTRESAPDDADTAPDLGTVTVSAPKPRPFARPEPIGTPDLKPVPVDSGRAPFPIKPKTSPFPRTRPKGPQFELVKPPKPVTEALITTPRPRREQLPQPPREAKPPELPFPSPVPRPQPSPFPSAQPPAGGGNCPPCERPRKPKKKKKPREECWEGTFIETATSLKKTRRRRVPCR